VAEAEAQRPTSRRAAKSPEAFRTISEVAEDLSVPQHVLRFWESKFTQVRPLKRGGGRRYYRPEDVALLRTIRSLLYDDGYTIRGVQKVLREGVPQRNGIATAGTASADAGAGTAEGGGLNVSTRQRLRAFADELTRIREMLKKARHKP